MRLIPQPEKIEVFSAVSQRNCIDCFERVSGFSDEEYELIVTPESIIVKASCDKGFFYAEQTLKQIIELYTRVPCLVIRDKPRYAYRGFMIDCARHMFSLDQLKKMIDTAASFKLNKFHWHLSDDQGFRIQLSGYPELTQKGSVRKCDNFINCKSDSEYSGYYTKQEIREIIEFCKERFIDVIPELDMPGHQSALLHVFPQFTCKGEPVEVKTSQGIFKDIICAGNDDALRCIENILDELCELFPFDTIHIGGDEVPKINWKSCEKCQSVMRENGIDNENDLQCLYTNKIENYLKNKGKKCIVWNDCLKGKGLSPSLTVQFWNGNRAKTAAAVNSGHKVIMSPFRGYYVDYPYGMNPVKSTYCFEPEDFAGLKENGKRNILGVESPIWTEHINNNARLEYMCFPRWFAVAETGWTQKENKSYKEFLDTCERLSQLYREKGFSIAASCEWNPNAAVRLAQTVSFFMPKKNI